MFELLTIAQAQPQGQGMTGTFILVGMMFLVFWLLVWRPQAKEQERLANFSRGLKKGDEVVTASGILGTVIEVDEKTVTLELSRNTRMRVLRNQVQMSQAVALADKDSKKDEEPEKEEIEDAEFEEASDDKSSKKKKKKQGAAW